MHRCDLLVDPLLLVRCETMVDLTGLLVLLEVYVLLERVQLLVELAPDLHLRSLEIQLVWLIQLQVLIVRVDASNCCLDQGLLCLRDDVVEEDSLTILICSLDRAQ